MYTTAKTNEFCLLDTILLHVIFAEGVPLCVSTAGSLSRAVECIAAQSVALCAANTVLPQKHSTTGDFRKGQQ